MIYVLTLYGLMVSHDLSAHTVHVKTARQPPQTVLAIDNCQ